MKIIYKLFFIFLLFFAMTNLLSCAEKDTYYWYDSDGSLIYKKNIDKEMLPQEQKLPDDTEKWHYVKWQDGKNNYEKIALRTPKTSYFIGNVFQIVIKDLGEEPIATGSGFVFNEDGWFITNAHVVKDAYYAQAIFNIPNSKTGQSFTYFDINDGSYYDSNKDIYIGKIKNYNQIKSYYKDIQIDLEYEVGQVTYSIGYPHSSTELCINEGEVTETWSDIYEKLYSGNTYICSSSYIAPGSSGGILINENFDVIGITTLGWTNSNDDSFISGASITAFNFKNIINNPNSMDLTSLQRRFHNDEKAFIGLFNEAKDLEEVGQCKKYYMSDGTLAYKYVWENEDINDDKIAYSSTETLIIASDGWIEYNTEIYWEGGDRRTSSLYGFYDYEDELKNFHFDCFYEWGSGSWYKISCNDINYSPTISLTLNKYTTKSSSSFKISDSNIEYAKKQFNSNYEYLLGRISRFKQ